MQFWKKFETDENYRSFFLDGQTIALDDYLEIRPGKKRAGGKNMSERADSGQDLGIFFRMSF